MSFGVNADGQVGAVARYVREGGGWGGGDALADLTRTFVADVLGHFPQGTPGAGVRVDASGHIDANSGNLTVEIRSTRLLLDTPDSAPVGVAADGTPLF
jgi:hypothetical protein